MVAGDGPIGGDAASGSTFSGPAASSLESACLWGNMPFGKSAAIISLALALNVTHIVESGRMGGLSLLHYHQFGFELVSIESNPIPEVSAALRQLVPGITLLDGDGTKLVPQAVQQLARRRYSYGSARIAVVIDGPKGRPALKLAKTMARQVQPTSPCTLCRERLFPPRACRPPQVAMLVVDDQVVRNWTTPSFTSSHPLWCARIPTVDG